MGISEGDAVDCGVGNIVWVRRRNGSWWPGRILGQSELSTTHLMSPRSGTPVKLLGREDASVDWYNLEKSKRVKAFRCGEFDECIRKAELSQGYPPKKREKYARREDAILHALELEKVQMEQNLQKFGAGSDPVGEKRVSIMKRDAEHFFPSSSKFRNDDAGDPTRYINIKSQPHRKVGSSGPLNEEYTSTPLAAQKVKKASQLTWEDDNDETMPRTRGLQDFGLKSASSKKKNITLCEGNKRASPSGNFIPVSPSFHGSVIVHEINSRGSPSSMKRKLLNGFPNEESLVRRHDRKRTLVQVLQSSSKFPLAQSNDASLTLSGPGRSIQMDALLNSTTENIRSYDDMNYGGHLDKMQMSHPRFGMDNCSLADRLTDEGEADSSDSDSSSHDMDEEAIINSDASHEFPSLKSKTFDGSGQHSSCASRANGKPAKICSGDLEDSKYSCYASRSCHSEHHPANAVDGVSKWQLKGKRNIRNLSKMDIDVLDGCADEDLYEEEVGVRSLPWLPREGFGRYWQEFDDCYDSNFYTSELAAEYDGYYHHDGMYRATLLDVDLKVQSSYQGEHVPLVSLMSRLNGKAIIGHPVQVEIMEDGSSDLLLADSSLNDDSSERNEFIPVPHVWHTGKRTVMRRVPRPQHCLHWESLSKKNSWSDTGPLSKKLNIGIGPKNMNRASHLPINKLSKKILKMACLSNQKTRMLSSFTSEQKARKNARQEETTPLVTCIPVKMVFDRLRECLPLRSAYAQEKKHSEEHVDHHDKLGGS